MSESTHSADQQIWAVYRKPIDVRRVDTDMVRLGWPKPTIWREHEAIHVLANAVDVAQAEIKELEANLDRLVKVIRDTCQPNSLLWDAADEVDKTDD